MAARSGATMCAVATKPTRSSRFVGLRIAPTSLAGSLAYGEQRMLEIARALATAPRLLMVDEPAAGLNAAEVERLLDRLRVAARARR